MSEQTQPIEEVVEETVEQTQAVEETPQEDISYKEVTKNGTIKLDLGKLKEFQNKNTDTDAKEEVRVQTQQTQEPVAEEKEVSEKILQEVTDEPEQPVAEVTQEVTKEEITPEPKVVLPENIESLVKFMEETGGTIEEYVRLNADYSNVDNNTLFKEYYKSTKSHLDNSEIDFLIEDNFSFDEELDEQRDIRKKKLALKEEVAKAKKFLNGMKDEYYKEVKLGSK